MNQDDLGRSGQGSQTTKSPSQLLARMAEHAKRLKVWLHFTEAKDEEAKCNLCCKIISCKEGNTISMAKHTSIVHHIKPKCSTLDLLQVEKTPSTPSAAAAAVGELAQSSSSTQISSGKHTKICRKSCQLKKSNPKLKSMLKLPG